MYCFWPVRLTFSPSVPSSVCLFVCEKLSLDHILIIMQVFVQEKNSSNFSRLNIRTDNKFLKTYSFLMTCIFSLGYIYFCMLLYLFPDSDLYFTLSVALCCFVMLLLCSALLIIFVCRQKASKGIGKIS